VAVAQDYRRQAQARMQPLDPDLIAKKIPPGEYHVSLKIDGEFNVLVYQDGEAILVNPGGTVRVGLPDLERAAWHLQAATIRSAVIAGELWYDRPDGGRERVHDVARVSRRPESQAELLNLRFSAFDLLSLDGKQRWDSFVEILAALEGLHLATPPHCLLDKADDIRRQFESWTAAGHEGIVIRSRQAGSYKVKPKHTIDVVVIGFTAREHVAGSGQPTEMHDLLIALMRRDSSYQVLGRVGGGFTDHDRRDWLCDLKDWVVGSDYVETNEGVAYTMVWPKHVIEISVLDLVTQSTRGQPVMAACLDFKHHVNEDDYHVGAYKLLRKLPLAATISPQFVRRRPDKEPIRPDIRTEQVSDLVEVPLVDRDARRFAQARSEVLRRGVWTKQQKGKTMVRKLLMWKTNKQEPLVEGGAPDYPAYVIAVTDYSPDRQTPLERDIRVSNSREQTEELWDELVKEKVARGWVAA